MMFLSGLVLLCAESSGLAVGEKPQPEFKIEVCIIESVAIDGVTKQDPNSLYHLRIKPALVITPADVALVQKRALRGPTIENRKAGESKHYPRLVVDIQLTDEAKLRLKTAVEKTDSAWTGLPFRRSRPSTITDNTSLKRGGESGKKWRRANSIKFVWKVGNEGSRALGDRPLGFPD